MRKARIDLHLHSRASNVTDYYAANLFSLPESYSDPLANYHLLKQRGMSLVTLTDHNTIDGCKELLDRGLEDVMIGAEMSASFPEDGCTVHISVINVSESQFSEIRRLRGNLYEMVAYINQEIALAEADPARSMPAYFMTHPLMSTENRPYGREGGLALIHIEKALLLCPCLEVRNGARSRYLNETTEKMLDALDPQTILRLANRHDIEPVGETPWHKARVAGSDDHSGLNPGLTWTAFPYRGERPRANDLIRAIRARETRPSGDHGGPTTLAHAMVKLMYDHQQQSNAKAPTIGRSQLGLGDSLTLLLRFAFQPDSLTIAEKVRFHLRLRLRQSVDRLFPRLARQRHNFDQILAQQALGLITDTAFKQRIGELSRLDDKIFLIINGLLNRIFVYYLQRLEQGGGELQRTIKEAVAMVSSNLFVSLPYFLSYFHQSSEKFILRDVTRAFQLEQRQKLVLVTDTLTEINGVSKTIHRMLDEAERRDIDLTVVACLGEEEKATYLARPEVRLHHQRGRLRILTAISTRDFPEYEGLSIRVPALLELIQTIQEGGYTKMQISTPGVIGLAGLLTAKLLQLPASSTYHTSFPEYVENYTQDLSLEALTWRYMILFYHAVDEVVVPSRFIANLLHERGLRNRKLLILDRWVDTERYHPAHRVAEFWQPFGIADAATKVKFLYVGRVAVEKDLALLAKAFRRLHETHPHQVHLIIVGDGPYRRTLEEELRNLPVTFTGFLQGDRLAQAYASADIKVFPSTTDTWGNAPLEAQASGLPVIVTDKGGPQELMEHEHTGLRIPGKDIDALHQAMARLLDPQLRKTMAVNARSFAVRKQVDAPYSAILDTDGYRTRRQQERKAKKRQRQALASGMGVVENEGLEIARQCFS